MNTSFGPFAVALACLAGAAGPARADAIVVDPHGGPGAALLQSALNAAHSGDLVLVEPGDYTSPVALSVPSGKGLALVADAPGIVLPCLKADFLGPGNLLLVRGLQFAPIVPGTHVFSATLSAGGQGPVWIEDCTGVGQPGFWQTAGQDLQFATPGLAVATHASAVVARCRFEGGKGPDATALNQAEAGGPGMHVEISTVSLFDMTLQGGRGGDGPPLYADPGGGPGLQVFPGTNCTLHGGSVTGGDEGDGNPASTVSGVGILCYSTEVHLRGTNVQPGGVNGVGTVGPAIGGYVPAVELLPAPPRFVAIDSPVREFETVGVHVAAQPGDLAWLFVSTAPGALWMPAKQGACMIDQSLPVLTVLLGATDPEGAIELEAHLPALPPGIDSALFFAQLAVAGAQGEVLLGTASSLVWLSASF